MLLILVGAVADLTEPMDEDRARQLQFRAAV
jgi:hypothetical protein